MSLEHGIKRNCKIHGYVIHKIKKTKNKSWYSCHECLKESWRKSTKKKHKNNPEYLRGYLKNQRDMIKFFSVYLKLMLYLSDNKPK